MHAQQVCVGRRTSALNSRVPADIDRYRAPAGAAAKLLLRSAWRRRQIWIKRQLLSTGQTDGRTDGRTPERYTDPAPHSMRGGGVNKPLPGAPARPQHNSWARHQQYRTSSRARGAA